MIIHWKYLEGKDGYAKIAIILIMRQEKSAIDVISKKK